MPGSFHHEPVLLDEIVGLLAPRPEGVYVDCTAGGGGHSAAIARRLWSGGRLIALDRDPLAVEAAEATVRAALVDRPEDLVPRLDFVRAAFSRLTDVLLRLGLVPGTVDGLLADLGVSSAQLDNAERGFSFQLDGPLDMRMDQARGRTAADLLASAERRELADVLRRGGEQRNAARIAQAIVQERERGPIATTAHLAALVSRAVGGRRGARIHPATRTFQALRMHVNDEAAELRFLLDQGLRWLRPGGRWALVTFHSGDDRVVKQHMAALARGCTCPPRDPICTCGREPHVKILCPGGITPGQEESARNPRSRTARLRAAERLPPSRRNGDGH